MLVLLVIFSDTISVYWNAMTEDTLHVLDPIPINTLIIIRILW